MSTAQALYEGISLGDKGEQGLITYMRTDSVRTEPQALLDVRTYIDSKFGKTYLPNEAVIYKKKKTDVAAQDAHESIRPTNLDNDPETIKEFLTRDEYELYKLIWNKFISSQMNPTVLDQTVATFEVHKHFFRSVGSVVLFDGFKAVYVDGDDKKDDDDDGALPKLVLQEALTPIEPPKLLEKFTSPPPRYTEATIIKTLEERGIGRPSTFSAIITNITDRQYVIKKEGKFHPTEVGTTLCYFLVKHFTQEMEYSFTAKFEDKLDQIEDGTLIWTDVLKEFWDGLSATIEKTQKEVESVAKPQGPRPIKPEAKTGIICPKCNTGELIIINGAKGDFLGCSAYPTCNKTSAFKKNKKGEVTLLEKKETIHKDPCPKCGSPMALRSGKFGEFFGCTKKDCNTTRPKTTGIICPDCKVGEFTQIKTKAGSTFYGCSNFRNGCKNSLNFKPLEEPCKNCQYPVRGCDDTNPQSIKLVCPKCRKVETL
jgi:DNA topoisomerase-1